MNYPIFVYGTLMAGERAFSLLAPHSVCYREALFPNAGLYASPDGYPYGAELHQEESAQRGAILGEVHWLKADGYAVLLTRLDQYEGDEYRRQVRSVLLCSHVGATINHADQQPGSDARRIEAWVYLSDVEYAGQFPLIADGNWRRWQRQGKD